MKPMKENDWMTFVQAGTRTAKLGIVLPSGRPSVVPVWFVLEEGVLRIVTDGASPKAKALRQNPRASLCMDLEEPPYAFVRVDAEAVLNEDPAEALRIATAVGRRYMGADRAEEFGQRNGGEGRVVISFHPVKVIAFDDVVGYH